MWSRIGDSRRTRKVLPDSPDKIDADLDDRDRPVPRPRQWDILTAIAAGGIVGAEGRYGIGRLLPRGAKQFPWATLIVNASGCLLIGVLMVMVLELTSPHRLARPFLGVGVLGGYTTFSTFAVDAQQLVTEHEPLLALGYVAATLAACLGAVTVATIATQLIGRAVLDTGVRQREKEELR